MKQRLFLTFDSTDLDRPILSTLATSFGLMFNIFGATVNENEQSVALELEGDEVRLAEALAFLREKGVTIEFPEGDESGGGSQ